MLSFRYVDSTFLGFKFLFSHKNNKSTLKCRKRRKSSYLYNHYHITFSIGVIIPLSLGVCMCV